MSTARFAILALVAACSSKKSAPAAPCLPGEISSTGTGIAAVDGITARACWSDRCLTLDRDGKATGPADHDAIEARRTAEATVTTSATAVKACANGGTGKCVEIPLPAKWTFASPAAPAIAASASLKRLSALLVDRVETWDLKAKELLSTFPALPGATEAHYVGDGRILARAGADTAWLLRDVLSGETVPVGEPGWTLTVIDATSAVVAHDTKLTVVNAAGMTSGPSFTLPGRVAMATAWFDRILVVLDHPAGTAQIDPATGTLYSGPALPICK